MEVIDTGIGMQREALKRIFSPFSQADADTTRLYGGTGLGLTLCRQLVERMHGQILVDSSEGIGTHFTVTMPLPVQETVRTPYPDAAMASLQRMGVAMAIPQEHPHRLAIESQLRGWAIPVRSASRDPDGLLLMATSDDRLTTLEFANGWNGSGVVVADNSGTLADKPGRRVLNLPLQRDDLFRCLCAAAGIPDETAGAKQGGSQVIEPGRALSILLVEDNQVNQLVASALLKKMGHRVDHAENGQRGLEALRARAYDLVLMDCQMPVMDGYEATRAIRENPQWQSLPVIAVTANVMQGDREDCLASGMNDYITKPYTRDQLRRVIARWAPPDPEPRA
jgi:CheY-like chemotaxis protein